MVVCNLDGLEYYLCVCIEWYVLYADTFVSGVSSVYRI